MPVALSCAIVPTMMEPVGPLSVSAYREASDARMVSVPTTPSTVAEMMAVPGAMERTVPSVAPTVIAAGLLERYATVLPVTTTPADVVAVATTTSLRPTTRRDGPASRTPATMIAGGVTTTCYVSTGGVSGVSLPQAARSATLAMDANSEQRRCIMCNEPGGAEVMPARENGTSGAASRL